MGNSFDPYYRWLGIPPDEQPPDQYRLLGVKRFEEDPDVIEAAADRQMAIFALIRRADVLSYRRSCLTRWPPRGCAC